MLNENSNSKRVQNTIFCPEMKHMLIKHILKTCVVKQSFTMLIMPLKISQNCSWAPLSYPISMFCIPHTALKFEHTYIFNLGKIFVWFLSSSGPIIYICILYLTEYISKYVKSSKKKKGCQQTVVFSCT